MADPAQASPERPYFMQDGGSDAQAGVPRDGLSTTPDDANQNLLLNRIATDMSDQSDALVAAIDVITAAINAKPSA